jgi:hypothetical protein
MRWFKGATSIIYLRRPLLPNASNEARRSKPAPSVPTTEPPIGGFFYKESLNESTVTYTINLSVSR